MQLFCCVSLWMGKVHRFFLSQIMYYTVLIYACICAQKIICKFVCVVMWMICPCVVCFLTLWSVYFCSLFYFIFRYVHPKSAHCEFSDCLTCCRCFGETLSTLNFAKRAKQIKNKVHRIVDSFHWIEPILIVVTL